MNQAFPARRTRNRVAAHDAATRASRLARENHQRFVERSLRNSAEAHGRSMAAQRRFNTLQREERGASGIIGTMVGLLILAVVSYGAYTFVVSSGLLH